MNICSVKPIVEEDSIRLVVALVASEGPGSVLKIEVLCDTLWVDLTTDEIEISLVVPPGQVGQGTTIVVAVGASGFVLETAVFGGAFGNEVATDGGTKIVVAIDTSGVVKGTSVF